MKITRNNYELWFLDYLEGNLDELWIDDFLEFLRENSDLAEELHLFETVGLTESDLVFPDKKKLYKESLDLTSVFDTTAVGFWEGDLDQDEAVYFDNFLKHHPEKNKELQLFRQTKLLPDTSVFFKNKQRLYRQPFIRLFASRILRIAAVFVFILAFSQIFEKQTADENSGTLLTIFTSDNQTTYRNNEINGNISALVSERPINGKNTTRKIGEKRNLHEKKAESPAVIAQKIPVDSLRLTQPPLLSSIHSSPVYAIKTIDPELMTPAFFYEIVAVDESVSVSLSHKFFQKIGLSGISPRKVVRWGLSLAANLTKEKFNYSTDASGGIIALNLDTRLVGLSIPVNRK